MNRIVLNLDDMVKCEGRLENSYTSDQVRAALDRELAKAEPDDEQVAFYRGILRDEFGE